MPIKYRSNYIDVSAHLEWGSFGLVFIRYGVHSELCPFGIVSIRNCVHSELCPFGTLFFWDRVQDSQIVDLLKLTIFQ